VFLPHLSRNPCGARLDSPNTPFFPLFSPCSSGVWIYVLNEFLQTDPEPFCIPRDPFWLVAVYPCSHFFLPTPIWIVDTLRTASRPYFNCYCNSSTPHFPSLHGKIKFSSLCPCPTVGSFSSGGVAPIGLRPGSAPPPTHVGPPLPPVSFQRTPAHNVSRERFCLG